MKQINVQFHAKRVEILNFLFEVVKENNLYIVSAELFPVFKYNVISEKEAVLEDVNSNMIVLSKDMPIMEFNSYDDFCKNNIGNLIIELGKENDNMIRESSMGCMSEGEIDILWRRIISSYKRGLLKGAWGVNPKNGNKNFYKNHYYTKGIKKAYEAGYKLCAFAGNCIYEISD